MPWLPGPLPKDTYGWGGVTTAQTGKWSFMFADFCGNHVKVFPSGKVIAAGDVLLYDNSLTLPGWPYSDTLAEGDVIEDRGTRLDG